MRRKVDVYKYRINHQIAYTLNKCDAFLALENVEYLGKVKVEISIDLDTALACGVIKEVETITE